MKFLKNTKTELRQNWRLLLIFVLILLLSQFALQYRPTIFPKIYLGIALVAIIVLFALTRLKDSSKLARNTFVLIMCLGVVNSLALPVRQELDENTHFFNAVNIANGQFLAHQVKQIDFLGMSPNFLAETQLPSKPEYNSQTNTNLYSKDFLAMKNQPTTYKNVGQITGIANPVYYPSALGIALGRVISPYFFVSYYLGRIFNLLMYALLAFFAVKISKKYKLPLFVASCLPYTVWVTAGYNYDALYYGLVLLLVAQLTNFIAREGKINNKAMIGYVATCVALVFCKAPIALLAVLPLCLPTDFYETVKGKRRAWLITIIGGIIGVMWVLQATLLNLLRKMLGIAIIKDSTTSENAHRLGYFLSHPLYTVEMALRSLFDVPASIYDSLRTPQPFLDKQFQASSIEFFNVGLVVILFVLVSYQLDFALPKALKIMIPVVFLVITAGIIYAISGDARVYHMGDLDVQGVQGRYHFYILVLLPLLLSPTVKRLFGGKIQLQPEKLQHFVLQAVLLLTFVNTCIGLFGYL